MPRKAITLSNAKLKRLRDQRYRRKASLRLKTIDDALSFANDIGFCFLWPIRGVELPSLWAAVAGERPVASEHNDPGHVTWGWKDQALDQRIWYYGKLLRGKATIVSLNILPHFYALSENFGDPEDYLQEYSEGRLSLEAKTMYEVVRDQGPIDSVALRREARMSSRESKSRFDKALTELQKGLKILPVGVAKAGAWDYAFKYELLDRWLPDVATSARSITRKVARVELLRCYMNNVFAATPASIQRLFAWRKDEFGIAIDELSESEEIVRGVKVGNVRGEHVALASIM